MDRPRIKDSTRLLFRQRSYTEDPPKNTRTRNGKKEVLNYIFTVTDPTRPLEGPVFVAESTNPIKWYRMTTDQHKRRRIALWLSERKSAGILPILTVIDTVWVPPGTRRSPQTTAWVQKLQPLLQRDPMCQHPHLHFPQHRDSPETAPEAEKPAC